MGNRVSLSFESCCEIEANNCIPVTWLALFASDDFSVETHCEDSEIYSVALYRTSRSAALQRVQLAIAKLNGQTPSWAYLRPLTILESELHLCSSVEFIELDVTQFWARDKIFEQKAAQGPAAFVKMLNAMTGDEQQDLETLNKLVNDYALDTIPSIADLTPEDRMFVLIGTYWGERESLYSLEYFDEAYWTTD
jgi:hypothetical protein